MVSRRRLRVPKETQIAGVRLRVERVQGLGDDAGQCRLDEQRILLDSTLPLDVLELTYLHELIEAANQIAETNLRHSQIEALAALLHQALTT